LQVHSNLQGTSHHVELDDLDDFSAIGSVPGDSSESIVDSTVRPIRHDCESTPIKPKRLSSYNLYFQVERQRILDGTDNQPLVLTAKDVFHVSRDFKAKPKRKHRKSHGRITFLDLARTIAKRWKMLDPATKRLFEDQAVLESDEYRLAYKEYKRKMATFNARKPKDSKAIDKAQRPVPVNTQAGIKRGSKKQANDQHKAPDPVTYPLELEEFPSLMTLMYSPIFEEARKSNTDLFSALDDCASSIFC